MVVFLFWSKHVLIFWILFFSFFSAKREKFLLPRREKLLLPRMHCSQKNTINKAQSMRLLNIDVICLKNEQTASSKQLHLQTNWICVHSENTTFTKQIYLIQQEKKLSEIEYTKVKSIVIFGWDGMTLELKHHKNVSTAFNRSITCKHLYTYLFSVFCHQFEYRIHPYVTLA